MLDQTPAISLAPSCLRLALVPILPSFFVIGTTPILGEVFLCLSIHSLKKVFPSCIVDQFFWLNGVSEKRVVS